MKKFFKGLALTIGVLGIFAGIGAAVLNYLVAHDDGSNIDWDKYKF